CLRQPPLHSHVIATVLPLSVPPLRALLLLYFFSHHTPTTDIYTLSLHDALPISLRTSRSTARSARRWSSCAESADSTGPPALTADRKSTRLNSSHGSISYAVFCLKKKKTKIRKITIIHTYT